MRAPCLVVAALAFATHALAQAEPALEMDYSNPGLTPSHWVLSLSPDGSGHFRSEHGDAPMDPSQGMQAADVDRDIHVAKGFAQRAFATAHQHQLFASGCESHLKVAFQGWKKISYKGMDGEGSCSFNYSKEKDIQGLGDSLVAVAAAIVEGARLETLLQHDRLGLDKETEFLVEAVGDGRVQQVCTIKGILQRLAEDPEVMDRVRKRAKLLLARAEG
ncbi:MAG: hypothetical protein ABSF53_09670 [Terracidiphilus sp.]|jgi:hypothetical protein